MALRPGQELTGMTRSELCEFASELCGKIEEEAGRFRYRGGIYAGNVSVSPEGEIVIGPAGEGTLRGTELLYTSPELYWNGKKTPAGDVYAVGLLLYYLSENRLPFESDSCSPRKAQQLRLQGNAFNPPAGAGRRLGEIIMKAVSFNEADRYSNVAEMKVLLDSCLKNLFLNDKPCAETVFNKSDDDLSEIERMMVSIIEGHNEFEEEAAAPEIDEAAAETDFPETESAETVSEPSAEKSADVPEEESFSAEGSIFEFFEQAVDSPVESVEESFEEEIFSEEAAPVEPVIPVESVIPAEPEIYVPERKPEPEERASKEMTEVKPELEPIRVTRKPAVDDSFPDIKVSTDGKTVISETPDKKRDLRRQKRRPLVFLLILCTVLIGAAILFNYVNGVPEAYVEPAETAAPAESEVPKDVPPAEEPEPEEQEPVEMVSTYEFVKANISWNAAKQRCEEMGGYLAVINSPEELIRVTALAERNDVGYIWIGLHRINGELVWEKEASDGSYYFRWADGEPSEFDGDTPEDYVLLSHLNGNWFYNDCIADPSPLYAWYWDNLGFVCEIEVPADQVEG